MNALDVKLSNNDTWRCEHLRSPDCYEPSTELRVREMMDLVDPVKQNPAKRKWTCCPTCGTYWRVWIEERIARPSIEWSPKRRGYFPQKCDRAPTLDIDRVLALVREAVPDLILTQCKEPDLAEDEGMWIFYLANVENDATLESPTGMCPFIAEHSDMKSTAEGVSATTVEQAAKFVIDYLAAQNISK